MSSEDVQSSKPQIYDRSIYDLIYDEVNRKGRQIYRLFFSRFENLTAKDRKMLWTMMTAKVRINRIDLNFVLIHALFCLKDK